MKILVDIDLSGNTLLNFKLSKSDIDNNLEAFSGLLSDRLIYKSFQSDSSGWFDPKQLIFEGLICIAYSVFDSDNHIVSLANIDGNNYTGRFTEKDLVAIGGGDVLKFEKIANCTINAMFLKL